MKILLIIFTLGILFSCDQPNEKPISESRAEMEESNPENSRKEVNEVLDNWHQAAAQANFERYFSYMSQDGVFIGTDATEYWQNKKFRNFAKPYFDKGKAWSFTSLERNIYLDDTDKTAWFDELLATQMGLCRGSGVLSKQDGKWKIRHYVLSIVIPNDKVDEVTALKKVTDSILTAKYQPK